MTTGIQANGTDLDSIFLPRVTTKRADVNWDSNGGVDISNRFQEYTSGTHASNTNLRAGGADLANLFQSISEPLYYMPTVSLTQLSTASQAATTVGIRFNIDGTYDTYRYSSGWTIGAGNWIEPTSAASGPTWHIKSTITNETNGTSGWNISNPGTGTWVNLASTLTWQSNDPNRDDIAKTLTVTFELSDDGGTSTLDTAAGSTFTSNYGTLA